MCTMCACPGPVLLCLMGHGSALEGGETIRQQLIDAIATIDVLTKVDIRTIGDQELSEYVNALLDCRKLLWEMLRTIDSAEDN